MSERALPSRNSFYNLANVTGLDNGRQRTLSTSSIDPYEDPALGLERVTENNTRRRHHMRDDEEAQDTRSIIIEPHEALSSKFESLNYEVVENQLYRDAEKKATHQVALWRLSRNRWFICFLIGLCTALVGVFIDLLVHLSGDLKFNQLLTTLVNQCDKDRSVANSGNCLWMVAAAWMSYNCGLVLIAALLVLFVSPVAAGSGIPQIKCYLNGIQIPEVVELKTLIAKSVGVSCAVGGGLCAGKEGPMIHSGGAIGALLAQGRLFGKNLYTQFRSDQEKRDFVSAGTAAGVAAAFGAPIGGVLFAIEEGASFWSQTLTWRMFFSAMISTFTLNVTLSFVYGQKGWLSWAGLANFGVFENKYYNIWEIPFFLAMGAIGGCTGALFNAINRRIAEFRKKYVSTKRQRLVEALLVAAVSAFTGFVTLLIVDDCVPIGLGTDKSDGLNQLYCKKGEYSAVANLFFANPEESVKNLFHSPITWTLLIFSVEYFILSAWTFGLSVPSGVFIPCLLTGAAWGRLIGIGIEHLYPNITGIDPGKYALMGAAAQLGGSVRMTISLTAILLEATKDVTFGLPIMLVLMVTKWVGDMFNEGLYDTCIELAEVPILGWNPPKMARNILASRVMRSDVVAVEKKVSVGRVLEILSETNHHAFPVVDVIDEGVSSLPNYGRLEGYILRSQLVTILRKKAFDNGDGSVAKILSQEDFTEYNDKWDHERVQVATSEAFSGIDLSPYMHPHPHRVPLNASLPFIYRLFRGLGLRYIMVVNEDNRLRGVITRKDVARFRNKKNYAITELYIADGDF